MPENTEVTLESLKKLRAERPTLDMRIVDFAILQAEKVEVMESELRRTCQQEIIDFLDYVGGKMNPDNFSDLHDALAYQWPDAVEEWRQLNA